MKTIIQWLSLAVCLLAAPAMAADKFQNAISSFADAGAGSFFDQAYGYAVFPTIGKAGFGLGGSYGEGRVYRLGQYVGDSQMAQVTIGLQLGGQVFSQVVFFQDKRAFDEFTRSGFEFGGQITAVALTAGVSIEASTKGKGAGVSGGQHDATHKSEYYRGMAVFTIAKGGLMYEAALGGQKFTYFPR